MHKAMYIVGPEQQALLSWICSSFPTHICLPSPKPEPQTELDVTVLPSSVFCERLNPKHVQNHPEICDGQGHARTSLRLAERPAMFVWWSIAAALKRIQI